MKLKIKDASAAKSAGKKVGDSIDLFDAVAEKWIARGWASKLGKISKEEKAVKETKELKAEIETKDATE